MGNITPLHVVEPKKPDEEVIKKLKQLLELAESGELKGLMGCSVDKSGNVTYELLGVCADSPALSMAIVTRLHSKIVDLMLS